MAEVADLSSKSPWDLLRLYVGVLDELRRQGITRSSNNPAADVAEYLFCKAFPWRRSRNSTPHFDAIGPDGARYQIKGRRVTRENSSRQLGAIRDLTEGHFDALAAVLFTHEFGIMRAAIIPRTVVERCSTRDTHTRSYRFLLRDDVWNEASVQDVTEQLRKVHL